MKHSKVLERIAAKHPEKIKEYWCDSDGHWFFLHDGWMCTLTETGCCHGNTVKETLSDWQSVGRGVIDRKWNNG